ncbi:CU044_5270 family protein [Phytohabitans suffuscus]|uniref:CU044_5270 family protein n=1 Tax=Phytohabitans suffuscus TaxID=624315 RepID=A0A6F8YA46_9ACTN|nr:CU044_5270 family protein [Phytohabitans suffuscus]BCB82975.1 hypothetical protein Psuf_002880 [Phytohabitans suffuscus]
MFDENSIRALLGPADPARDVAVPHPRVTAAALIAAAEAVPGGPDMDRVVTPAPRARRRLVVATAAVLIAAGTAAGTVGAFSVTRDPAPSIQATELSLGPVVRPAAMQYARNPQAAGDRLRALAEGVSPAPHDNTTGRYTYIHTVSWNAVFDDNPDGTARVIHPQDKHLWYAPDASGRIKVIPLPAVYPNEQSRRYWQQRATAPPRSATGTPDVWVHDLPAGMAGPTRPLSADPAELAKVLGVDTVGQRGAAAVFFAVRDLYSVYAPPRQSRAQVLRILADLPGVSWRGTVTDRAGRAGVAISVDTATTQQILILDPKTGALLAWDEVERPTDTVAGATLFLGYGHTDHLG